MCWLDHRCFAPGTPGESTRLRPKTVVAASSKKAFRHSFPWMYYLGANGKEGRLACQEWTKALQPLEDSRRAHASANAHGHHAVAELAALHLTEQRGG